MWYQSTMCHKTASIVWYSLSSISSDSQVLRPAIFMFVFVCRFYGTDRIYRTNTSVQSLSIPGDILQNFLICPRSSNRVPGRCRTAVLMSRSPNMKNNILYYGIKQPAHAENLSGFLSVRKMFSRQTFYPYNSTSG